MIYNGKEYKLRFTLGAWAEMEDAGVTLDMLKDLTGNKKRVRIITTALRCMANAALDRDEFTDEMLLKKLNPLKITEYWKEILEAVNAANHMETEDPDKEVDLVLAEIQKKSTEG